MAVLTAPDDTSELLTVAEAMAELRCSESTVRRLIATGELPAVRLGTARLVRIPRAGLDAARARGGRMNFLEDLHPPVSGRGSVAERAAGPSLGGRYG